MMECNILERSLQGRKIISELNSTLNGRLTEREESLGQFILNIHYYCPEKYPLNHLHRSHCSTSLE